MGYQDSGSKEGEEGRGGGGYPGETTTGGSGDEVLWGRERGTRGGRWTKRVVAEARGRGRRLGGPRGRKVEEYRYTWSRRRRNTYLPTYLVYILLARCTRLLGSASLFTSRTTVSCSYGHGALVLSLSLSLFLSLSTPFRRCAPARYTAVKSSMMHTP